MPASIRGAVGRKEWREPCCRGSAMGHIPCRIGTPGRKNGSSTARTSAALIPVHNVRELGGSITQHLTHVGMTESAVDAELTNRLQLWDRFCAMQIGQLLEVSKINPAADAALDAYPLVSVHGYGSH